MQADCNSPPEPLAMAELIGPAQGVCWVSGYGVSTSLVVFLLRAIFLLPSCSPNLPLFCGGLSCTHASPQLNQIPSAWHDLVVLPPTINRFG